MLYDSKYRFYQPYFDVKTDEIIDRVKSAIFPYKRDFYDKIKLKPDMYIPFWTFITITFLISMVSNAVQYQNSSENYRGFNFSLIPSSFSFVFFH